MKNQKIFLKRSLVLLLLFAISSIGLYTNDTTMGLITKVILEVMKKSETTDWKKTEKGEVIKAGDALRTGKKSLAVIKFKDNSMLRVREQSELKITSDVDKETILKNVKIQRGTVGFDVKKQQNEQFILSSPTSIASIRGTQGKISSVELKDTVIVIDGLVNLRNILSNNEVDITSGFIGFSNPDGTVSSREATERELADARLTAVGGDNELNLEFQNQQGNRKELKIRFREQ